MGNEDEPIELSQDETAARIAEGVELMALGCAVFLELGYDNPLDNNFLRELLVCRYAGLTWHPGRGEADATDDAGREYELKGTNVARDTPPANWTGKENGWKKPTEWASSRDASPEVIRRYREMAGFYFAVFDGLDLVALYYASAASMAPVLDDLERRTLHKFEFGGPRSGPGRYLNNPRFSFAQIAPVAERRLLADGYEERFGSRAGVYRQRA